MKRLSVLLLALVLVAPRAGLAADVKAAAKPKKNQAWIAPDFAAHAITSIGMAPVSSIDHNEENERLFKSAVETGFGTMSGYKLQGTSWFLDTVRKAGAIDALTALEKSALAGTPVDTASFALLRDKVHVDAILFARLSTWTRQVVDPSTRGQSFTQVGGDFALLAMKDGAVVWRGTFLEKGDGPYNDPNTAEVTERDATGNSTAKAAQLEPPSYREVLEKLVDRVRATVPKAPAKS